MCSKSIIGVLICAACSFAAQASDQVQVEVYENIGDKLSWKFERPDKPVESWTQSVMGFARSLPHRYTAGGVIADRDPMFLVRATATLDLPAGSYRLLLRSLNGARLFVDDQLAVETHFIKPSGDAHGSVEALPEAKDVSLWPLPNGHNEKMAERDLKGTHRFVLEAVVGGKNLRPEIGHLVAAIGAPDQPLRLIAPQVKQLVDDSAWPAYAVQEAQRVAQKNADRRHQATVAQAAAWEHRHAEARQAIGTKPTAPSVKNTAVIHNDIDRYLQARLESEGVAPTATIDDQAFIRRLSLDTRGVIPALEEVRAFLADKSSDRRAKLINHFLEDPRWADHWTAYWQDVLAENPGILKPQLNNTGPFRWWIHESFLDNKPIDRFVTELVMMEGSRYGGGPAGFAMASQNDVPMAAKAHILGTAFLGVQMKCARCHNAPFHDLDQIQLFSMAAMLERKPITLPKTSSIPLTEAEISRMVVEVTLKPGQKIQPVWGFDSLMDEKQLSASWGDDLKDSRLRLAALITAPQNQRFARVIVNRLWKRWMGAGFVEPVDDWEGAEASHPELLDALAWELVDGGYDLKHVARLIFNSHAYQRVQVGDATDIPVQSQKRLFAGPMRRRMVAEQVVDSLFAAAGKAFDAESLTMDADARRPAKDFQDFGSPDRAWQFCSLSNERDRPSLGMPRAQSVIDVLSTFSWRQARQDPLTSRDATLTPLQPLILANGTVVHRVVTLSDDSAWTAMALQKDQTPESLTQAWFLRVLNRMPKATEQAWVVAMISEGFSDRIHADSALVSTHTAHKAHLSWSNHLSAEANQLKLEEERQVREGDPPTARLDTAWRQRAEDAIWALINTPEFVFVP